MLTFHLKAHSLGGGIGHEKLISQPSINNHQDQALLFHDQIVPTG